MKKYLLLVGLMFFAILSSTHCGKGNASSAGITDLTLTGKLPQ